MFIEVLEITTVAGFTPKKTGSAFSMIGSHVNGTMGCHRNNFSTTEEGILYALLSALRTLTFNDIGKLISVAEYKGEPIRIRVITSDKNAASLIDSIQDEQARKIFKVTRGYDRLSEIHAILEVIGATVYADHVDIFDRSLKHTWGWAKRITSLPVDMPNSDHKLPDQFASYDRRHVRQFEKYQVERKHEPGVTNAAALSAENALA